jgi:hypothetical protein
VTRLCPSSHASATNNIEKGVHSKSSNRRNLDGFGIEDERQSPCNSERDCEVAGAIRWCSGVDDGPVWCPSKMTRRWRPDYGGRGCDCARRACLRGERQEVIALHFAARFESLVSGPSRLIAIPFCCCYQPCRCLLSSHALRCAKCPRGGWTVQMARKDEACFMCRPWPMECLGRRSA